MKKKTGFTLIELIVAVTIGMLVVGFGSIALNDFSEKQKIEAVKKEVLASLRLARNYAITNQLATGGNNVAVTVDNNGLLTINSYDENGVYIETFFSKDITPKNVWITADKEIKFSVTDGRSINEAINIGVSGVVEKIIKIDESGLIYEE